MLVRWIATRLLNRHVARRITRVIPHPGVRAVAMLATSVVIPIVVEKVLTRTTRRLGRASSSRALAVARPA